MTKRKKPHLRVGVYGLNDIACANLGRLEETIKEGSRTDVKIPHGPMGIRKSIERLPFALEPPSIRANDHPPPRITMKERSRLL